MKLTEELILEAYKQIRLTLINPKTSNNKLAKELYQKYHVETEDLIQDLILLFMKRKHKPIRNMPSYINTFVYRALLDIAKYHGRQKRIEKKHLVDIDDPKLNI